MKNFIQPGGNLTLIAAAALTAGEGLKVGTLFGVVQDDAAIGTEYVLVRTGVYELPKATGTAWAVGDKLYWNDAAGVVTKAATGNAVIGAATAVAGSADALGLVLLDGVIR